MQIYVTSSLRKRGKKRVQPNHDEDRFSIGSEDDTRKADQFGRSNNFLFNTCFTQNAKPDPTTEFQRHIS